MAEHSRYSTEGNIENGILKNKAGIKNQKQLENLESLLYSDSYTRFLQLAESQNVNFNIKLIFNIHKYFLGTLYEWAGKTRNVDISKEKSMFCSARHIGNALKELEKIIQRNLPANKDTKQSFSEKLAIIHCEFNAIHPFREGNGRTIRLFLDLIAVAWGFNLIDYSKSSKKEYIKACIAGMKQDYSIMQKIMYKGLSSQKL